MSKEHRGLTAPLGDRPSEPFFIKGPMANHLMNMILDEPQCQSCRRHITSTEGWLGMRTGGGETLCLWTWPHLPCLRTQPSSQRNKQ